MHGETLTQHYGTIPVKHLVGAFAWHELNESAIQVTVLTITILHDRGDGNVPAHTQFPSNHDKWLSFVEYVWRVSIVSTTTAVQSTIPYYHTIPYTLYYRTFGIVLYLFRPSPILRENINRQNNHRLIMLETKWHWTLEKQITVNTTIVDCDHLLSSSGFLISRENRGREERTSAVMISCYEWYKKRIEPAHFSKTFRMMPILRQRSWLGQLR